MPQQYDISDTPRLDSRQKHYRTAPTALGRFGHLPAEIRAMIWEYAAMDNQYRLVDRPCDNGDEGTRQVVIPPPRDCRSLVSLSRSLRYEIHPYMDNKTYLKIDTNNQADLSLLPDRFLRCIKHVVISRRPYYKIDLKSLASLRKVIVGTSVDPDQFMCFHADRQIPSNSESSDNASSIKAGVLQLLEPWMRNGDYKIETASRVKVVGCVEVFDLVPGDDLFAIVNLREKKVLKYRSYNIFRFRDKKRPNRKHKWIANMERNDGRRKIRWR